MPVGEAPNGSLVRARDASLEVGYRCPGCRTPLLLRRGQVRSPHFAHKTLGFCAPETALHQGVKLWIAQMLRKGLGGRGGRMPRVQVPCAGTKQLEGLDFAWRCPGEAWFSLEHLAFDDVAVERETPEGLRPDLLLLRQGEPVLGIEVRVTHAVDAVKAAKTTYPWVEVEANRFLASPRSWRPCQGDHPWTGSCRVCACVGTLDPSAFSEITGPGDFVAQVSAASFHGRVADWLQTGRKRLAPAVGWRCPWCWARNRRSLCRERVRAVAMASSLNPPIHAQVILHLADGPPVFVSFGFPRNPRRPSAVVPLGFTAEPSLRVTPDLKRPHRLDLNGTNRPLAFVCGQCGGDCIGVFPSPLQPVPPWDG